MIATTAFGLLARTDAAALGLPDPRIVEIPHPLAGAPPQLIAEYARRAVDDILALLAT